MFLDTWWFYLQHICLLTNILVLAMQGGCVDIKYSTVKQYKKHEKLQHSTKMVFAGGH